MYLLLLKFSINYSLRLVLFFNIFILISLDIYTFCYLYYIPLFGHVK
jgi:hypothetical protein